MGVQFARTVAGNWAGVVMTLVVVTSSFGALNSCLYLGRAAQGDPRLTQG